ncbi:hypothetical protein FH966_09800 [Lentibacillus cibarius]|uniref:Atypical membrane-integrating protein (Mistic protein) n=1 Tax=Lentibacillus cibarius TaxID=2583219 RepID=A0A549YJB8_9BACI|nr:hypothetical protein [Lentibacillus cibarius]TMN23169.1 hypothetical protein FFL34_14535 [Lentibacillus cibarius]TRM11954.1 hypothetical protein FH966_09800 [Lentibacillus cibarius]
MKANETETKRFDKALDEILDLYNNLEEDEPVIQFETDVMEMIERAKVKYGNDMVNEKINTVVRAMLSWLDLDDVTSGEEEETETAETAEEAGDDTD